MPPSRLSKYCHLKNLLPILTGGWLFVSACQENKPSTSISKHPAIKALTDSIEAFPKNARLFSQRGRLWSEMNEFEAATADFLEAHTLSATPASTIELASAYFKQKQPEKAISLLTDAVRQFPLEGQLIAKLSEAYELSGNTKQALSITAEWCLKDSTNPESYYTMGLLQTKSGDTLGAIQSFEKAFQIAPITNYGLALAHLLSQKGDKTSLSILATIIERDSAGIYPDPFYIAGNYQMKKQQWQKAITNYNRAIAVDWTFLEAHLAKGNAQLNATQFKEALQTFEAAAAIAPQEADCYAGQGKAFWGLKQPKLAAERWEQSLQLNPNQPDLKALLSKAAPNN